MQRGGEDEIFEKECHDILLSRGRRVKRVKGVNKGEKGEQGEKG